MNVTIISGQEAGGAGDASKNLFKGFLNNGVKANYLSIKGLDLPNDNVFLKLIKRWLVSKNINRNFTYIKDAPEGYDYFTFSRTGYKFIHKHSLIKNADIINIHWVSNMIDYESFFKHINKPVIWTLHDTNPFTGGCHYTFGCDYYLTNCGDCMQLSERVRYSAAKNNLKLKISSLEYLDPAKTVIVSPSQWLKSMSEKSAIFKKFRHLLIPYGIDTQIFKNYSTTECRRKMELPADKFIILFVGTSLLEYRKGFDVILKIADLLKGRNDMLFLAAGKSSEEHAGIKRLGYIADKNEIAAAYNAADVFLIPSREDNLPNTMLESLCCGTPVIGFKTGGIVDAVEHGKNGFLVEKEDVSGIIQHIYQMLENKGIFNKQNISNNAIRKYSLEKQANSYKKVMNELLIN